MNSIGDNSDQQRHRLDLMFAICIFSFISLLRFNPWLSLQQAGAINS
jgi:hypothetical protein